MSTENENKPATGGTDNQSGANQNNDGNQQAAGGNNNNPQGSGNQQGGNNNQQGGGNQQGNGGQQQGANQNQQAGGGNSEQPKPGTRSKNFILVSIAIFVIVCVLLIWFTRSFFHLDDDNYTNDAQIQALVNPINTKVSAYIQEIRFSDFQRVKRGDTLVILDSTELKTKEEQSKAELDNAWASKYTTMRSVLADSNKLSESDANIAGARAKMLNAENIMIRYGNLYKGEAVSLQQYQEKVTDYESNKSQYQYLINQKRTTALNTQETSSKLGSNNAEIERATAALNEARVNLSYCIIVAPTDGVLGKRSLNVGQLTQSSQKITDIVTNDARWVIANYREKQMDDIRVGKLVTISVDALGGKNYEGKIVQISPATGSVYSPVPVDNSTGNFVKVQQRIPVKIEFTTANSQDDLALLGAGMNVEVNLK